MILRPGDGRLRVVTQNDHAHFSAELLALWHIPPLPHHPRRQDLLFAAREHDNGWREADSAPRRDPVSGRPHSYRSMPGRARREIWSRGTLRFADSHPYPSLLILQHALHLHRRHAASPDWAAVIAEWQSLAAELMAALEVTDDDIAADYRWIDLSDHISLALCAGWGDSLASQGFRFRANGEMKIAPFPLAGATTFRIPCRHIPDRPYASDCDLGVALASARWEELTVRVAPFTDCDGA